MTGRGVSDIARSLLRKGFGVDNADHKHYDLYVDGKEMGVSTFLSHGIREYGDDLLGQVARQLHLKKRELLDLVDCRMAGEQYVALLIARAVIAP